MRFLMLAYMAVYALAAIASLVAQTFVLPPSQRDPLWETVTEVVLLGAGFLGMLFYSSGIADPQIVSGWKVVAPSLLVGQVGLFVRYLRRRPRVLEQREVTPREAVWVEIASLLLLAPSLGINLVYAYG